MRKIYLLLFTLSAYTSQAQINANTFGMMNTRNLGPGTMSGRISAIEGVNNEPRILYVGTAGGGVWKSTNAGASFKPLFDKYCQSIGAIAIDQKNPKVLYVGTGESNMRNSVSIGDGLYKSTDAGDNWTKIGLDSTEHIARIAIDPSNNNVIYVAAPGPLWSDSKHRGLYKSTDGGKTWEKILYINEKAGCAEVVIDPKNPNTVYASTWEFRRMPYSFNSGGAGSGFYKSIDGGKTWKEITNGLPAKPFGRIAFNLAPSDPKNIVAIVESGSTGLYISSDGGENWKSQSAILNVIARPFYFSTIVIDPKDAKRVYRPAFEFSYSDDGGYSFATASNDGGWIHSDMHALWINPNNTNNMYVGTDGGVYMSNDKGATWIFCDKLPVGQFYHVSADNQKPYYRVYGGLQDNGSWVAPSSYPGGVSNAKWESFYGGDGFWTQPDLTDANIAYAEAQGGNMGRVDLRTFKSTDIQPKQGPGEDKLRWNWNTPIVLGLKNPGNLYTGAQYLYKSTDQGRNWTRISGDLTTNDKKKQEQEKSGGLSADNTSAENHCTIFTIAESPLDENIIWVGTDDGNIQYTTDGGKNWTNVSANWAAAGAAPQSWVSSLEPSRHDKNTIYVTTENHMYGDMKTYCGVSRDMGKTWIMFKSNEFSGFAHKIAEDHANSRLLFVGTEMGLFASVDAGNTWFRMKNDLPWYALVRDIKIHPSTNDLILATHGRGIMIVDDISVMRTLTPEVAKKDFILFPQPNMLLRNGNLGGVAFPPQGWVSGNTPDIAAIQYYLKDRLNSGDVKLDILDAQGNLVQTMPGSKRKGVNKVYWNMRGIGPKTASGGAKPDQSGFVAPMVLPGSYTIKLTIAGKEYTTPVTMVHDKDNPDLSEQGRTDLYNLCKKLASLHERLAVVVEDVSNKQSVLKAAMDSAKDAKLKKAAGEYWTKLETFRGTLLPTKAKSIFADERRLREEISEVYIGLCFQEANPSNTQLKSVDRLVDSLNLTESRHKALMAELMGKINNKLKSAGYDLTVARPSVSQEGAGHKGAMSNQDILSTLRLNNRELLQKFMWMQW
jgi:photosystem II stability/assembly factor-like uncharacterized protein